MQSDTGTYAHQSYINMKTTSPTLIEYADLDYTQYTYCYSTFHTLHPEATAYLEAVDFPPDFSHRHPMYRIMGHFRKLAEELFRALAETEYILVQRSACAHRPSVTNPLLGLSFEPVASPKRDCILYPEQLQIVDQWRVKFDALIWVENVATGRHAVAFTQHQQQQRNLQLSRVLHDVNRWLVEWDTQGRGCGRRPAAAKVSRPLASEPVDEYTSVRGLGEEERERWQAKRMKKSHDCPIVSVASATSRPAIASC